MPKDISKLSLKTQKIWARFGHLNLAVTQLHMVVTQTHMGQIEFNLISLSLTSAYMEYEFEMRSIHLDLAKHVLNTHTHSH